MKLFSRKNKGHKLVDEDDMEEEEQDFDNAERRKSLTSAVLVVKDENALIHTSNRNEMARGGAVPKQRAQTQQYTQNRVGAPALFSTTTATQLFGNEKFQPVARPSPTAAVAKKATGEQRGTQELFSIHKLQHQQQLKINSDNSSSSCYSDASSMSIGANNENKSPFVLLDAPPSNEKEIVSPQPAGVSADTTPMIQKSSQQQLISPASGKKGTPSSHRSDQERQHFVRSALRRPFGRENIPPSFIEWTVSVDTPFFYKEKKQWGYEITLKRSDVGDSTSSKQNMPSFFHTRRTLQDFCLLELALIQEFSGSLLVPVLELYCVPSAGETDERSKLQVTDNTSPLSLQNLLSSSDALEPEVLQWWLTDVIHGIRGDGEVILNHATPQQVILSDSMQIFFSQAKPGEVIYKNLTLKGTAATYASTFGKNYSQTRINATIAPDALLRSMLSCFSIGVDSHNNCNTNFGSTNATAMTDFFPKCSSRSVLSTDTRDGIHVASHNFIDSSSVAWNEHAGLAQFSTRHGRENYSAPNNSDIIDAYNVFFESFNSIIPFVQQKIDLLLQLESTHGIAWKSFSDSLSNFLSFEKEILECKIGTPSSAENRNKFFPKSFKKNEIDDCLKLLAHHKEERGTLGLQALHIMIESFHTDTRSIPRSLNVYLLTYHKMVRGGAVQPPMQKNTHLSHDSSHQNSSAVESAERVKQFVVQKIDLVKKQLNLGTETMASTTLNDFEDDTCVNSSLHESFTKHSPSCNKILADEAMLHLALGRLSQATPVRIARMSWKYFKAEAAQASLLSSAAADLKSKLAQSSIENQMHVLKEMNDEQSLIDDAAERTLVERILDLSASDGYLATHREIALEHHREQVGRWDAQFTLTILAATGVADAQVRIEETTRELRFVRNIAIELRKCVDHYAESLEAIKRATKGLGTEQANLNEMPRPIHPYSQLSNLFEARSDFVVAISQMFSASLASRPARKTPSVVVFAYAGINISDPSGWLSAVNSNRRAIQAVRKGLCGRLAADYFIEKDKETSKFLAKVDQALHKYEERVERIESSVYMHCVGIQLEKHFSKVRADSLAEWEKKTDIIQAIAIATRKRLPQLVNELERKLESFDSKVSHTYVKQAKERHLASKNIKTELQELADRRLDQAKESAMEIIIGLIRLWAEYEETNAAVEVTVLERVIQEIERCVRDQDVEADGVANQLF